MSKYRNNENIDYINQEIIKCLSLDGRIRTQKSLRDYEKTLLVHQRIKKLRRYRL
jgi:Lrp/AsnC family transcriptional regulator for asnA, asnC and gidA